MSKKKLGRNEPCWCGSGFKYKHCHLKRERQQPPTIQEIHSNFKKTISKEYCLHPQASPSTCSGNIVRAHLIQRNGGLNRIARDGHVYNSETDLPTLNKLNGKLQMRLVGTKNASTFTGFCGFHDNVMFQPIEQQPFQSTALQTFLLGFRALSMEVFRKRAVAELLPHQRTLDRGKSLDVQLDVQGFTDIWELAVKAGLRDLEDYKKAFDQVWLSSDFSAVRHYVVRFDCTPEFLCSGAIYPECDFNGRQVQDLSNVDETMEMITYSLIPTDTGGVAVFMWLGENRKCIQFIKSLADLPDEQIPHAVTRFTFEFFENVFISPDWWDNLTKRDQEDVMTRQISGTHVTERSASCLLDDGKRLVAWSVTARETNLSL